MQRDMRDANLPLAVAEAEHEDAVLGREPAHAGDERRIAVEVDAGGMNGRFGVRRTDHGGEAPFERGPNRLLRRGERGAAVARRDTAKLGQLLLHRQELDAFERQAAGARVQLQHRAIADQHRAAELEHGGVARRLERDLRADAGRVAGGDGHPRLHVSRSSRSRCE